MYVTLLHDGSMSHYACMSHYGMVPMHVTLWYGTNACHTVAWYQCISQYGMIPMHVTLYIVPMHVTP